PGSTEPAIRIAEGARVVLSARAEGPAADYPWIAMRPANASATRPTPIAAAMAPKTPLTSIRAARDASPVFKITAFQTGGVRSLEIHSAALPVTVGRSRSQTLIVDRRHEGVSGHHLDIVELGTAGATVVVHGDNGVLVEGVNHAQGARFDWRAGQTMVLGDASNEHPACTLTLACRDD
ncbi:MAG: hypothetical protein ABIX12_14030, partial [Rubrivivax sp.]